MHNYNLPKSYLSASQLKCLFKCERQYYYKYVEGIKSPGNANMLLGSACHRTHEQIYKDKMAGVPLITPKQTAELVVFNFDSVAKEAVENDGADPIPDKDKDVLYGEIINVEASYVENIVPSVIPIAVELEFIYTSRCGIDLLMYVDLVKQLHEDDANSRSVIDYKITQKKWNIQTLLSDVQFILYTKALDIPQIEIHNLVKGSRKAPAKAKYTPTYIGELDIASNIRCLQTTYAPNEYEHLENIIEYSAMKISSGVFAPCDPSNWVCTPKWCAYYGICRGKK